MPPTTQRLPFAGLADAKDAVSPRMPSPARGPVAPRPEPLGRPTHILALDIETVPDAAHIPADWPADKFPKVVWHQVVAISFVSARIEVDPGSGAEHYVAECCRSGGEADWDEPRLLRAFWKFFAQGRYRVVTYNGRGFDLVALQLRSMIHGIAAAAWFTRGDRWNGYQNRYSAEWHADLLELLSGHGATTRMGLEEVALALGLPGKGGESGAGVAEMMAAGEFGRIRDYCESDTLNTVLIYFRWALLTGRTDPAGYDASVRSLAAYLEAEHRTRPHLGAFLDRWRGSGTA